MSEEFYMSVTFSMPDAEHMEALETLIEHFDLCEVDEARDLMAEHRLNIAQHQIEALTPDYCDYKNGDDLAQIYYDNYNQCVDDLALDLDPDELTGNIEIQGQDSEADTFGATMILVLLAMHAYKINAEAETIQWEASWRSADDDTIQYSYRSDPDD